jgi:uncharacterized protein
MNPQRLIVDRNVAVPMRDGVRLAADIYRPDTDNPVPVLLQRTPYGKGFSGTGFALWAAECGYAVVLQDTRGRWASEGDGYPFIHEMEDGYDTVEWAGRQSWSNGKVGMFGESYPGYTQYAAAFTRPPSLRAIIPSFAFTDPYEFVYRGGALNLGASVSWGLLAGAQMAIMRDSDSGILTGSESQQLMQQFIQLVDGMARGDTFQQIPLEDIPLVGRHGIMPLLADILAHPENDDYWQRTRVDLDQVAVPALHFGGWYDIFISSTLSSFSRLHAAGQAQQQAIIGPWVHADIDGLAGEMDFGLQASGMMLLPDEIQLSWFDRWLKDESQPGGEAAPLRIFVMGANHWRDEYEWPLNRTRFTGYYLHSGGSANTLHGDGSLSPIPPGGEPPDHFLYDPHSPTPSRGGGLCCWNPALPPGVFDQREIEERQDVLVYSSAPLEQDIEVTGPVVLHLWAASSAPDTDFTAKLVEVSDTGYARNICDGILRAKSRTQYSGPLEPDRPVLFEIELGPTSNRFPAGSRIRLEVASSSFPKYDRNPNTGSSSKSETRLAAAHQTVFHQAELPSRLILPVVP